MKLHGTEAAAEYIGVTSRAIRQWITDGKIKPDHVEDRTGVALFELATLKRLKKQRDKPKK